MSAIPAFRPLMLPVSQELSYYLPSSCALVDLMDAASAKTVTRLMLRDYPCDMLPVVKGFGALCESNEWGDDVAVMVQYRKNGACALLGGSLGSNGRPVWTVYAD